MLYSILHSFIPADHDNMYVFFFRRHFCPHKPQPETMVKSDAPCNLTEYTVKFKHHDSYQPRAMIKPPKKMSTQDTKMDCDTTTQRDFIAHPVTPPTKAPPIPYKPPDKEMQAETEYKQTYLGKWQVPTQPIRPPRLQTGHAERFDHVSTQTADYTAPSVTPRKLYKAPNLYEPPTSPFDERSTTQCDFVQYGMIPMTPSLKPPPKVVGSTQPLDETTSYRSTFTTPIIPDRFQKEIETYVPSTEKFSHSTTFRSAFPNRPFSKPRGPILPPSYSHIDPRVPLEATTTNRATYKTWEIPKRLSRPPTTFVAPTEKVSDTTTFKSYYVDHGKVPLPPSFKPAVKSKEQVVPLENVTTHSVEYKAWTNVKRPEPCTHAKQYEPPQEKFDSITTFKAHYKGAYEPPPPSIKPPQKFQNDRKKLDSTTVYKEAFSGPGYKPCPTSQLLANDTELSVPGYVYSHEGRNGHKFYKPAEETVHN